jgi:purine-binding chemotaxis protein CheW
MFAERGNFSKIEKNLLVNMMPSTQLVVFTLDGQPFALDLAMVHRVVPAIEVTSLPNAPSVILGVVNIQGELLAVVDLRRRFGLPERDISLSDQLIIANITRQESTRRIALLVDAVTGIRAVAQDEILEGTEIVSGLEHVRGVVKIANDLILVHNLERCLSLHEEKVLEGALAEMGQP